MSQRQDQVQMQPAVSKPYLDRADILIIGNGIAGLTAALEARHLAPDKRIVIITDQIHPTINTPALKQFAIDKLTRDQLLAYPAGTERAERIHVVTAHVEAIHAQSKYVSLSGGRGFGYDALLIATGSTPTKLPENIPGSSFDGVLTLHRLHDYLDLRRRLGEVSEAVVIGGGVHAIETVMGMLHWGIRVHWLVRSATLMAKILDATASEMILNSIRRAGVIVHTETEVTGIVGRIGAVAGVITNQQEMIPCELVLACTGTQPSMALAKRCSVPMLHKNGIMVDDKLRTSVRDIYAAGDVAALRNPQTGGYETRALWYAAVAQGRIAGAMMVGHDERAQQPFGVQWHGTYVGSLSMLTVGKPLSEGPNIQILTDTSQGNYRRLAVKDDRLVGYLSLGSAQPDSLAIKRIVDEGISIRAITKPLLKGNFDARDYLSQQHTYTARRMLTGTPSARSAGPSFPETGQMLPVAPARGVVAEPVINQPVPMVAQNIPSYPPQRPAGMNRNEERPVIYEEEFSPFTGNLPSTASAGRFAGESRVAVGVPAVNPPEIIDEDLSPFSGNLPVLSDPRARARERQPVSNRRPFNYDPGSVVVPEAAEARQSRRNNLWMYVDADAPEGPGR